MRRVALAVAFSLLLPATASGAVTLSRQGGTVRIVDDAGGSARQGVSLGSVMPGGPVEYYAYESASSGYTALRNGPGCTRNLVFVSCPAAGVTQLVAELGDGNDTVSVTAGPAALIMDGGPGDDIFMMALQAASVTVIGGEGDDRGYLSGFTGDGERIPPSALPVSASFDGGPGKDSFEAEYNAGNLTARGGDGDDSLEVLNTTGPATLDGGPGNDYLSIGSDDPDLRLIGGGRTLVMGGPGDDDIDTGPDGDEDVIECGPGHDNLRFNDLMFRYPSLENSFSDDCPPVGVRLGKRATLRGRTLKFSVQAPRRISLDARLTVPQLPGRWAAKMRRPARLHAGANRVSMTLSRKAMRKLAGPHTPQIRLFGFAISPSQDAIQVRRGFDVKRVGH